VLFGFSEMVNQRCEEPITKTKPFCISKQVVWEAYRRVKANQGAAGVDGQSIKDFEVHLKDNQYKIWNRMSSGSYFPPPVRTVDIPKSDGRSRRLGIPSVSDRVAQMVVKMYLEPKVEPIFHPDSYGYISGKSALDAVSVTRKRCWWYDWVIDLDVQGFFDNIDHALMMHAVKKHISSKWMLLYIERWLKAPAQLEDGSLIGRNKGTPQGGVISPLLANIFLHHVFDEWMRVSYPKLLFSRYADELNRFAER
jgi:RNA-directed DNA polymerase